MLPQWTFSAYISPAGKRRFSEWYDHLHAEAQGAFDVLLEHLIQRPRNEWRRPEFDILSGKYAGMGELRFDVARVEHRPLGFFGPSRAEFTLLIGATKKGQKYDPHSALETARKRMGEIKSGVGSTHVWDF